MRAFIAIFFSVLFIYDCSAQDKKFHIVQNAMRRWQDTGLLIYLRTELAYSFAQETLMKGVLSGRDEETKKNKLILTQADKKIILEKLRSRRGAQWPDSLFDNSRGILRDTLQAILYDRQRGWPYFHQYIGKGYFQFSEPLFIRNSSYAILSAIHMVGQSAGYNLFFVYKKVGDDWKRFIVMPLGAW